MAPDEPDQSSLPAALVTVYINVYCVDGQGNADGPYTQAFDVPYDLDFGALESTAESVANAFCGEIRPSYISEGTQFAVWEFRPPMYYQYFRGA